MSHYYLIKNRYCPSVKEKCVKQTELICGATFKT